MKIQLQTLQIVALTVLVASCGPKNNSDYKLTSAETSICTKNNIDPNLIGDIRSLSDAELTKFNSAFKMHGSSDDAAISGIMFDEDLEVAEKIVVTYRGAFKRKGYSLFVLERNYGLMEPDRVGILKTMDHLVVLQEVGTNGVDYGVNNDSVISIMRTFDEKYDLELVGAGGDWCEYEITKAPKSWTIMAEEVFAVCKDVVNMGPGSVDAYAEELEKTKRLSFFWDASGI